MIRILKYKWDKNKDKLREAIKKIQDMSDLSYEKLVKLTFDNIFNIDGGAKYDFTLNTDKITVIDDGDYQGTQLFMIPFDRYQPDCYEYLMTYVWYGSCSGCDTLLGIVNYCDDSPTDEQVEDLMTLCRDLVMHTIKPYRGGWFDEKDFEQVEFEEKKDD